ncbi:MAG: hypothetical protein OEV42_03365 [Deltaproteobacteria bacterium]|nr:hypothetical protein [Deltaproteobacteria bacterium]
MAIKTEKAIPANYNFEDCYDVDTNYWSFSDEKALFTCGAGPCLTVVVHSENKGCLAHVHTYKRSQKLLYERACLTILAMITEGAASEKIDLWLGAGTMFFDKKGGCDKEFMDEKMDDYIVKYLQPKGIQVTTKSLFLVTQQQRIVGVMNTLGYNPGDILYFPKEGKVYMADDNDANCLQKRRNFQAVKTKAPRTWQCPNKEIDNPN